MHGRKMRCDSPWTLTIIEVTYNRCRVINVESLLSFSDAEFNEVYDISKKGDSDDPIARLIFSCIKWFKSM